MVICIPLFLYQTWYTMVHWTDLWPFRPIFSYEHNSHNCDNKSNWVVRSIEMLSESHSRSVAGSWGVEKRKQLQHSAGIPQSDNMFRTVSQSTFTYDNVKEERDKQSNKFSKFVSLNYLIYNISVLIRLL